MYIMYDLVPKESTLRVHVRKLFAERFIMFPALKCRLQVWRW